MKKKAMFWPGNGWGKKSMGKFNGMFRSEPWLGIDAIKKLEEIITPQSTVLETGAGSSTLWFAERVAYVLSYEHKIDWYQGVKNELDRRENTNVILWYDKEYPRIGIRSTDNMFDLVLIDGRGRVKSILTAYENVKPGGWIVLDNANRPRYSYGVAHLDALGWRRLDVQSLIMPERKRGFTSFWRRPA